MLSLLASIPSPPDSAIHIGGFQLHIYGVCIALGVLAAVMIASRRWADRGGDPDDITSVAIIAVPAGLIGARLYHVITDFELYKGSKWPNAFYIWNGGLGIPGGVLLGALGGWYVTRRMKINWRLMADAVGAALPVAQAIGRVGNYFNQELFGGPTTLPWGLEVDPKFQPLGDVPGTLYHPTFLYEALWNLGLFALIVMLGRRFVLKPGRWFAMYVMGYGLGRFWVELMRSDHANHILGLRVNTWTSSAAIVFGAVWLFWKGSPVDVKATEELRSGGDPLATAGAYFGRNVGGETQDGADQEARRSNDKAHLEGTSAEESGADSANSEPNVVAESGPEVESPATEGAVAESDAAESSDWVDK